jgi:SAM-dependent methyltransferase
MDAMIDYYSQRAPEYEEIYKREDPARRNELRFIGKELRAAVSRRRVLELACGTGYWTELMAEVANHLTAVDASPEMLQFARAKVGRHRNVQILGGDAYAPGDVPGRFNAGVAMFWFSHIHRARLGEFLEAFHRKLDADAIVFMADNVFVPGIGGDLVHDREGLDTYKLRKLKDGSEHRIIKNYYSEAELKTILEPHVASPTTSFGTAYWWTRYAVRSSQP